jgi:hypothetical protein
MAEITAAAVKELRELTGVPMMDCKKALVETNGGAVVKVIEAAKLTPHPTFRLKVVQLYELLEIRHSVFLISNSGAGKSSLWKM